MGHTISRKGIKRFMTILTAAVLVLLPLGEGTRQVHAEGEGAEGTGISLEHTKTVTENADGTYDLKLTVKGKVNSQTSKIPLDVIYVLDKSGSMNYRMNSNVQGNGERRKAASQAINSMTQTLEKNENLDVRFSLVTFSGDNDHKRERPWDDAAITVNWTSQSAAITRQTSPNSDGGTNYQAGIRSAGTLLAGKRPDAKTAVIFVSDGDPTFRYDANGYTEGTGNSDENEENLQSAKTAVADLRTDYFFTVGVGPEANYKKLTDLAASAIKAGKSDSYAGTTLANLNQAFNDIQAEITRLACRRVSISDPLSENVDLIRTGDGTVQMPQVRVYNASGNEVNAADLGITAVYDASTRSLKLQFPEDYELEDGYTYELIAQIQPTEQAYETYRTSGYTDTADAGTGTYAGQKGFYSNQNEEAKLTYEYKETGYTELYKKPVVRVYPGNLKITKTIAGLEDNAGESQKVMQNMTFTCLLTKPDGSTETKELKIGENGLVWNADENAYIYTFSNLTPGTAYQVKENNADAEGYDRTTTPDNGQTSGQIARGSTSSVEFVNRYIRSDRMLTVEKRVGGNMGDRTKPFDFEIRTSLHGKSYTGAIRCTKYDAQGNPLGEESVTVKDGVCTFQLKHMEKLELVIPYGVEYRVSEEPEDYEVKVTQKTEGMDEQKSEKKEQSGTLYKNTELLYTNTREIQPATGVQQTSAPYLVMTGLALGILGFFSLIFGIGKWKDRTKA